MKKLIILIAIAITGTNTFGTENSEKINNLGLFSELAYIRAKSENTAALVLSDSSILKLPDSKNTLILYNDIRVITDQIILQLIADCYKKNSLGQVKALDRILSKDGNPGSRKKNAAFVAGIQKAIALCNKLSIPDSGFESFFGELTTETALDFLGTGYEIYKDIRANRKEKVANITTMLQGLRLRPLHELLTRVEKTSGDTEK